MALEKKYSEKYYSELLKKYISGEISRRELFLLEKKAIDDPFLFEAMQGYEEISGSEAIQNIDSIKNKINSRKKEKKRIPYLKFIIPAAAASLLLLFAVSNIIKTEQNEMKTSVALEGKSEDDTDKMFAMKNEAKDFENESLISNSSNKGSMDSVARLDKIAGFDQKTEKETSVKNIPTASTSVPPSPPRVNQNSPSPVSPTDNDGLTELPETDMSAKASETKSVIGAAKVTEEEPGMSEDQVYNNADEELARDDDRYEKEEKDAFTSIQGAKTTSESKARKKEKAPNFAIDGVVLSTAGEPLIGVNINALNNKISTYTDIEGKFNMSLPAKNEKLNFNYVGFVPETISIDKGGQLEVILNEEPTQFMEAVIADFGVNPNAQPAIGYEKFKIYIKENIRPPELVTLDSIKGKVTVQFDVDKEGQLDKFIIIDSLCEECDKEAIRLLKEGGKWIAKPGNTKTTSQYSIDFDKK